MEVSTYHERQSRELCALHALNNLFQDGKAFTKRQLDDICLRTAKLYRNSLYRNSLNSLSPSAFINPHRSVLGLGNYDVNVIMAALQQKGFEAVWFDKRKDLSALCLHNIMGFIMNIPSDYKLGFIHLPFRRKHWIAIRDVDHLYWNFDSKLAKPELIGTGATLITYLSMQIRDREKELILVVDQKVAECGTWYKGDMEPNGVQPVLAAKRQSVSKSSESGTKVTTGLNHSPKSDTSRASTKSGSRSNVSNNSRKNGSDSVGRSETCQTGKEDSSTRRNSGQQGSGSRKGSLVSQGSRTSSDSDKNYNFDEKTPGNNSGKKTPRSKRDHITAKESANHDSKGTLQRQSSNSGSSEVDDLPKDRGDCATDTKDKTSPRRYNGRGKSR